jgi:hypothetical protein
MRFELAQALANTGLVVGSALVLWWFWRREAARLPVLELPAAQPRVPPEQLLAEVQAAQQRTLDLMQEARRQWARVQGAFESGLRDGRTR